MANIKIDHLKLREKIEYGFTMGLNKMEVCNLAGISRPTLDKYLEKHPKFSEKIDFLKENVKMHAKLNIAHEIIKENSIETSKYYLEKTSDDFKSQKNIKVDGKLKTGSVIQFIEDVPDNDEEEIFGVEDGEIL